MYPLFLPVFCTLSELVERGIIYKFFGMTSISEY